MQLRALLALAVLLLTGAIDARAGEGKNAEHVVFYRTNALRQVKLDDFSYAILSTSTHVLLARSSEDQGFCGHLRADVFQAKAPELKSAPQYFDELAKVVQHHDPKAMDSVLTLRRNVGTMFAGGVRCIFLAIVADVSRDDYARRDSIILYSPGAAYGQGYRPDATYGQREEPFVVSPAGGRRVCGNLLSNMLEKAFVVEELPDFTSRSPDPRVLENIRAFFHADARCVVLTQKLRRRVVPLN